MTLVVCDTRATLGLRAVWDRPPIRVGPEWHLRRMVSEILYYADSPIDPISWVTIIAHGLASDRRHDHETLGHGIEICNENLTYDTVHFLAPLAGRLDHVDFRVCGLAHIATDCAGPGQSGDGWGLCVQIARTLRCRIRASSASQVQRVNQRTGLSRDLRWRGMVYDFGPHGESLGGGRVLDLPA